MTTLAFDSLKYARRLREAGVPELQAEVQAELMAEAFGFYADNIVTKDYLDSTLRAAFAEQDAKFEQRFAAIDQRFIDIEHQLGDLRTGLKAELETMLTTRLNQQDVKLASIEATMNGNFRVLSALMGVTLLAVAVPAIQSLL
tara:strand:- start:18421 stop:18849 length:429 start_codon:yes stop_codon:yes gene_type:complete